MEIRYWLSGGDSEIATHHNKEIATYHNKEIATHHTHKMCGELGPARNEPGHGLPLLLILHFAICILHFAFPVPALAVTKEKVVFWFGATQDERAAYEQMIRDFNQIHPNIEVQPMLVPQQYVERKLLLSVAGRVPPDVVRFYTHLGGEMMPRGGLELLDGLIRRDGIDLSDFYEVAVEQNSYNGRLYGMPWILSPYALFYNKKLFREAGLDPNRPPRTWAELEKYAMRLTVWSKDGLERIGYADFLNNPSNFQVYLWQSGGNPLSPDIKRIAFNGKEGVEALTWMRDFLVREVGQRKHGLSPQEVAQEAMRNLQTFSSAYVGATQDPFGLERIAMRIDIPFRIPDLKKYFPDLDFGIAQVPYNRVPALEVVGNALVIPRGSLHKEAAWEFIKFATTRDEMLKVCRLAGRIPARRSAATTPAYYNNPLVKPFVDQIGKYGRTTPIAPGYREASDALSGKIELALKGQLSPEAALTQAAEKGQEILDEANEDVSKYPMVPWVTVAIAAGGALILAIGGVWWFVRRETRGSRMARHEAATFYLFLAPWIIGFVVFTFGSVLASFLFSFARWDILSPARFVGLGNYAKLIIHDPRFIKALANTVYYAAFTIPLAIAGGLAISVLVNQKLKGIQVFRTIYYMPAIISGVATALLWQWIFNPKMGLVGRVVGKSGLDIFGLHIPPGWLSDPNWAKPAFIVMSLWGIGGAMVIYLAGLQGIPEELYEAAKIDGASAWKKFRHVTLPLLTPAIFYQLIVGTMAAFQFFLPAYIMTGGTGGPNDSTMFYSLYLFKNAFEWMKMGYASAMAWILFAIVMAITLLQFKGAGRWVYYEGRTEE